MTDAGERRTGAVPDGRPVRRAGEHEGLCREIAARAREVPGVAGLHPGAFGDLATPVPGGRIEGVLARGAEVRIGIRAVMDRPLRETAEAVRRAVRAAARGRRVHVSVEDVAEEPGTGEGGARWGRP
ncbi:hypothetical protein [Nocardiopsis composta]|uniref:Asp23/Gls24 family envelope stress response protein n=1 Tax=Nocardiopsis composta TaxID=157465 RepID=A0A7W8QIZ5_9ACTN|nr:hypothetical protein [Nocardiopsis composta]MBB5431165.1 hypothetical protein [Nocardiopsis composta]